MEITVNQNTISLTAPCSVTQLLADVLRIPGQGIAVAINETILSKTNWPEHLLRSGDKITIIKATQGG